MSDQDNAPQDAIADDVIVGAEALAKFLGLSRRQIYNATEHRHLPVFRVGVLICARRSTLLRWISEAEAASVATPSAPVIRDPFGVLTPKNSTGPNSGFPAGRFRRGGRAI